jgi:hypothetical protein
MSISLALVSKIQPVCNYNGEVIGNLIVQIEPQGSEFEVNSDFFWTSCPSDTTPFWSYVGLDNTTVISSPPFYYSTINNNPYMDTVYKIGQQIVPVREFPISNYTDIAPPIIPNK